ncbi:MAG: HAD-IA family hydrolase, partial [Bacteroidaceae bacterium]|nr:HAD-IA family hydrolase [Bacteroidaceae bacterium]
DTLARQTQLVPHAIELLDYLTEQGYNLYILSNGFIEVQHKKLQSAGISHYFERMVLSDEIGINKPDRRLFDYALEVTNSQAENTLLIGDNYDADILGAMHAGWGQIYFDRNHRGFTEQEPQYIVHNLTEVMDIL